MKSLHAVAIGGFKSLGIEEMGHIQLGSYEYVHNCLPPFFFPFIFMFSRPVKTVLNPPRSIHAIALCISPAKSSGLDLEQLVFEGHVRLRLETNAGTEDVGQGGTLLGERVDDGGTGRSQRGFEHVAEDAQDAVEALVLGGGSAIGGDGLPLDTSHHLSNDNQVNDQGRG